MVDGENPAGYSDLLLDAQKLERRPEARDPLPPKTAVTSELNICSQTPGNLFPSCKLKGNCTFTTSAVTVGSAKVRQTPVLTRKEERWNLWLMKRLKHQVE